LVWKLDRLSRSLKDLINTLDELGSCGIDFLSYDNNLDTSTPTGKLVFQIVGAVAEFEKTSSEKELSQVWQTPGLRASAWAGHRKQQLYMSRHE